MTKFVKIQSCYRGNTEDELINIDDIGRICLGPNILFLRTPYNLGEHHISITQNSVDKLLKVFTICARRIIIQQIILINSILSVIWFCWQIIHIILLIKNLCTLIIDT